MKRYAVILAALPVLLAASAAAWAQAPGPGGTATQGFTVETLISQLSLYLPEDSTRGLGGFGRGAGGQGGQGGQAGGQAGAQAGGQGADAQAGTQSGTQVGRAQGFRQLFQFSRDAKLYMTKDQIAKLLPILQGLRENPMPTPSRAKQVQASVDSVLTVAQKAEYTEYQKQMQKALQEMRKQFAANNSGSGGQAGAGNRQGESGQAGAQPGQGRQGAQGAQSNVAGNTATAMTPTERRERELDAFIKVLQDRQKQATT